jgi:hypothetical protein
MSPLREIHPNNQLLYFPYISVPESDWTIRSILYWENVGAIVPQIYKKHPNRLEKHMHALVEMDLVQQIFPYEYIYKVKAFDDSFIQLTHHKDFNLNERKAAFQRGERFPIHIQKVGDRLMKELIGMGIAKSKRNTWEWFYVEIRTAKLFMMYLASVIGKAGGFTPATNSVSNIDLSIQQNGLSYNSQRIRGKFLKDLMPYPLNPDLNKLKKFKEKNFGQLKHFRLLLEQSVLQISSVQQAALRNELYEMKKEEILHCKEEISAKLGESKFGQITFGTIFGLAGAITSFALEQQAIGLFSLTSAIYSSFQGYDRPELDRNYSYLALVERHLKT